MVIPEPFNTSPSLPPAIINTYTAFFNLLNQTLPTTIHNTFNLAYAAISHTLTPSILTSFLYRIFVLYAAMRIIPAVRGVSQEFTSEPNLDSPEPVLPAVQILKANICSPPN